MDIKQEPVMTIIEVKKEPVEHHLDAAVHSGFSENTEGVKHEKPDNCKTDLKPESSESFREERRKELTQASDKDIFFDIFESKCFDTSSSLVHLFPGPSAVSMSWTCRQDKATVNDKPDPCLSENSAAGKLLSNIKSEDIANNIGAVGKASENIKTGLQTCKTLQTSAASVPTNLVPVSLSSVLDFLQPGNPQSVQGTGTISSTKQHHPNTKDATSRLGDPTQIYTGDARRNDMNISQVVSTYQNSQNVRLRLEAKIQCCPDLNVFQSGTTNRPTMMLKENTKHSPTNNSQTLVCHKPSQFAPQQQLQGTSVYSAANGEKLTTSSVQSSDETTNSSDLSAEGVSVSHLVPPESKSQAFATQTGSVPNQNLQVGSLSSTASTLRVYSRANGKKLVTSNMQSSVQVRQVNTPSSTARVHFPVWVEIGTTGGQNNISTSTAHAEYSIVALDNTTEGQNYRKSSPTTLPESPILFQDESSSLYEHNSSIILGTDTTKIKNKGETGNPEIKPYMCSICRACFTRMAEANAHAEAHGAEICFYCSVCNRMSKTAYKAEVHMMVHSETIKCGVCGMTGTTIVGMEKHYLREHVTCSENKLFCLQCKHVGCTWAYNGERRYLCHICGARFAHIDALMLHTKTHAEESDDDRKCNDEKSDWKPVQCKICGKWYANSDSLDLHTQKHGEKKYKCEVCGECFHFQKYFYQHKKTHAVKKGYKCNICDMCFDVRESFQLHKKTHGKKPYRCTECEKCFSTAYDLKCHTRLHSGEKPYQCTVCGKCFAYWQYLKRHKCIEMHSAKPQSEGDNVNKKVHTRKKTYFAYRDSLQVHRKVHTAKAQSLYLNTLFGNGYTFRPYLPLHDRNRTGGSTHKFTVFGKCYNFKKYSKVRKGTNKEDKPYQCTVCGKCFALRNCLQVHERIHSGGERCECTVCGKYFATRQALGMHKRRHTGHKKHQCAVCGKCFLQKSHLLRHTFTHTGEKLYQCPVCQKGLSSKYYLQVHKRVHTGEKPYQCTVCGKCFADQSVYKRHESRHTGATQYKCVVCGKCFSTRNYLELHKRIHSGEKPYQCLVCGKSFSFSNSLQWHMKVHT